MKSNNIKILFIIKYKINNKININNLYIIIIIIINLLINIFIYFQ